MPRTVDRPGEIRVWTSGPFVLVGSKNPKKTVPPGFVTWKGTDLSTLVRNPSKTRVTISATQDATERLLKAALKLPGGGPMGRLLTLETPRPESVPTLSGIFERIVGAVGCHAWLPLDELTIVISGTNSSERFIGGAVDFESTTLALVRGDLAILVVPFAYFAESGDGTVPDFEAFSIADYGLTIAFGRYEASADGILYEFDAAYRRRLNKERSQNERAFGASLRRLRLQRGLGRGDFGPLTSKTIGRIERGDVEKPHGKTLGAIAKRLGVEESEISTY